ncbi:hypothetical protein PROFUN_03815 [Planoprotostelium fungivorum]|uniref:Uncharacterized protein n=1 Tax=Planoprotostelium fungivorum TaxID=1890364 RepID=A0A2P6NI68_9EUKA|nr:hypothetical protein PROFUN_03815 [Planoprotostelium fungivorum]
MDVIAATLCSQKNYECSIQDKYSSKGTAEASDSNERNTSVWLDHNVDAGVDGGGTTISRGVRPPDSCTRAPNSLGVTPRPLKTFSRVNLTPIPQKPSIVGVVICAPSYLAKVAAHHEPRAATDYECSDRDEHSSEGTAEASDSNESNTSVQFDRDVDAGDDRWGIIITRDVRSPCNCTGGGIMRGPSD